MPAAPRRPPVPPPAPCEPLPSPRQLAWHGLPFYGFLHFTVNTFTDNQHFTFLLPGTSAVWGTLGGTITMTYNNAAIPVKIMRVQSGNSMTVAYNPANNTANWNTSGSCALCVI